MTLSSSTSGRSGADRVACSLLHEKLSAEYPDVVFAKVDTEDQPELVGSFNIRSIPTLMIFRDQIGIFSQPGALPEPALEDLIDQALALDMDDVRESIATG